MVVRCQVCHPFVASLSPVFATVCWRHVNVCRLFCFLSATVFATVLPSKCTYLLPLLPRCHRIWFSFAYLSDVLMVLFTVLLTVLLIIYVYIVTILRTSDLQLSGCRFDYCSYFDVFVTLLLPLCHRFLPQFCRLCVHICHPFVLSL